MNDQYSPERDQTRALTLQALAIIAAIMLIIAAAVALYKLDQSQAYDAAGNLITDDSSSSTYSNDGEDDGYTDDTGSDDASGDNAESDTATWEAQNPELAGIVTECGNMLDLRVTVNNDTELGDKPVTTFYEHGIEFAYNTTNETNRQAMTCVGKAIGANDPNLFYRKITALGKMYQDPGGGIIPQSAKTRCSMTGTSNVPIRRKHDGCFPLQ
ncbi:hypothetical protein [Bifidobacterium samirii]|uniref:Uncharacterized protein n=1 Tax=Bifidobacterium samirii TaxID=2306974 RepID=A0A430FJH1_9BIFI|nr:hypothetical protein [Bifidobacterium samirii]RSX52967.1 hypothetical protein D2E24_1738 [Bifidobacterium samirii]